MNCENCGNEHDGSYGSGRFCSKECRGAFAAKNQPTGCKSNKEWTCKWCGLKFNSRKKMYDHIHAIHGSFSGTTWNKGLTKETSESVAKAAKTLNEGLKSGRITPSFTGRHLSQEHKDKIVSTYIKNRTNNKYRGTYKGIPFQYSFELAWIVWNIEHEVIFYRCDESFRYFDSIQNKMRIYYPDFKLEDGTIVEIKGRVTQNTLDKKQAIVDIYHRPYLLLTQDKIQHCLDYCTNKYGDNFLQILKDK